ncbi:zinc-ribbon domain-containing protein [Luteimonas fraxinea]|uniref:Zinc-ribbon domain-containing protein n=1 Tax=Luteimonas fraxinea TaxID=2901869 RepID=A0ABS8UFA6_9GAMM|nr:zinc-ribbon domain-containing protein [Luteimonas fraxinea]MCD9097399.1 zinc-ribbon domain-containing protein [Luteimonas fraxinea]UHH11657.1 zinc-ribbon domain-containing protein [Luteimonas fraxinea]
MALVQCVECGREISDRAIACPQCGYPRRRTAPMSRGIKILLGACVLLLVAMFVFAFVAAWMLRKPIDIELPQSSFPSTSSQADCLPHHVCAATQFASR